MAEIRFHLNAQTGNPNICRAKSCRTQPENRHYRTSAEAESARSDLLKDAAASKLVRPGELNPKTGFLRNDYAKLATPRGVLCPNCFLEIDHRSAASLVRNLRATCSCGESYELYDVCIDREEVGGFGSLLDRRWYHATDMSNWIESVHGESPHFEAHVGTESAAFDRGIGRYATHRPDAKSFYLYEVSISSDAHLFPLPMEDENDSVLFENFTAVPYLNLWEDMASISLAVRSDLIIIESMREVSVDEAHRRVSLCNLEDSWD